MLCSHFSARLAGTGMSRECHGDLSADSDLSANSQMALSKLAARLERVAPPNSDLRADCKLAARLGRVEAGLLPRCESTGPRHQHGVHSCVRDFILDHGLDLFPALLLGVPVIRDQSVAQGILRRQTRRAAPNSTTIQRLGGHADDNNSNNHKSNDNNGHNPES